MTDRARWAIVTSVLLLLLAIFIWLVAADAAIIRFTVRLYQDKKFLKDTVRPWLSEHHWNKMNFILEAEGVIICFILYLIPGFPKDIISYLFGISPMPF